MKKVLVAGAGGFIGHHLVNKLKDMGYFVIGVDVKFPEWEESKADDFIIKDLRDPYEVNKIFAMHDIEEVYQLAADMGGMGFIHTHEVDCLVNNASININMSTACRAYGVKKYFYSSSVCVYKDTLGTNTQLTEADAYPASPDNEYGWEKLYSERVALAIGRHSDMEVRIARFENCYGPEGTYQGGREKAPAAICRKVALAKDNDAIEVWGDGTQTRNFIYVEDLVEAIIRLMASDIKEPVNIGTEEIVTINELVDIVASVAGKKINKNHIEGIVGVKARNFSHELIRSTGWEPKHSLKEGITKTYNWINKQVCN